MTNKNKIYLLIGISIAAFVAILSISPIRQDPAFHNFADGREIASIKNFMNVISNIPFLLFGTAGLWMISKRRPNDPFEKLKTSCIVFLVGIFFTGIGSAFYHSDPNNFTLIWDRLPMTISFMAFFSILTGVMIDQKLGKQILWPLILFGIISILYWGIYDDLRLYALVQFLPVLLTPLILLAYNTNSHLKKYFWLIALLYATAKLFEAFDIETYNFLNFMSGHTIKHLFAASVPLVFILMYRKEIPKGSL
jgi:hypothetical protein